MSEHSNDIILVAENISKQYRLGVVGTGTLSHDLNRWWHRVRGKDDPFLKVGSVNDRSVTAESDYAWALKSINFEVRRGEVLGIIGKNGAGKSTLLKILSRVTGPTTGEIKTKGRIASLLEVGTGFHPELTGRENIYLNGAILGMSRQEIEAKEDEIIEFSGCQRYINTPVKRYSSGMRVRLAFAVAAHLEPDILVIDEVLAVGDAEFQKKAIGKMQEISKGEGRTVLFVSHNMESIQQLCTRCIVLEHGVVRFDGNVNQGISQYLNNQAKLLNSIQFPIVSNATSIEDFYFLDDMNHRAASVLLGSSCQFVLCLKNLSNLSKEYIIRIQIFDLNEKLMTTLNNYHQNSIFQIAENGVKTLSCSLDKMPLTSGDYVISLRIQDFESRKVIFYNENFFKFEVESGDFYKSGKIPNIANSGVFLVKHEWRIKND